MSSNSLQETRRCSRRSSPWRTRRPPSTRAATSASSSTPAPAPARPSTTYTPTSSRATSTKRASVPDTPDESTRTTAQVYADGIAMVQLLGPQDRLLRVVEREHPDVDVHVRGN